MKIRKNWLGQPHIEHERITSTLVAYEQELIANRALQQNEELLKGIHILLEKAREAANQYIYDQAWKLFHSAKRLEIMSFSLEKLRTEMVKLNKEAVKATPWRKESIITLTTISEEDFTTANIEQIREKIAEAMFLLHDHYDNVYLRINRRKRQIALVSILLGAAVSGYLVLNWGNTQIYTIAIIGVMGSLFSTAVTLTKSSVNEKTPDQVLGAWITFLRPFIGAASALVANILLESKIISLLGGGEEVINVIAFVAGFSERYIINALENIVKPASNKES